MTSNRKCSIYRLSDEEKKAIKIGRKDLQEGRLYTSEQADTMIKEWLNNNTKTFT